MPEYHCLTTQVARESISLELPHPRIGIVPTKLTMAEDLTTLTGHEVSEPLTSWLTLDGPYTVEHVAAVNRAGDLLVFY